jgi:rfaE bifunctional protein kinase chain/domain
MVNLTGILSRFDKKKILVAGDLMLDAYTFGKAKRISPEAPVAVVQVQSQEHRPGGSGNVILNLVSMGAHVVALGRIGLDANGALLKQGFAHEGVDVSGIVEQENFQTPIKNRIIADSQQLLRIDQEECFPLPEMLEQKICEQLPFLMEGVAVVAISDYGKGFLSRSLLAALIDLSKSLNIPVISDPKGIDFSKYSGSSIIKPNLSEAYAAANLTSEASLDLVAEKVLQMTQAETLMITRSEKGISLFHKEEERQDFPVRIQEVKDVTGAGDTVLAMLAYSLANELSLSEATQLANVAASIAIERIGCARVTLGDLARRLLLFNDANKIFNDEHAFALKKALENKKFVVLSLSGLKGLTSSIFHAIKQASGEGNELLVFIRDSNPDTEFINILAAFHDVHFIFLSKGGLQELCNYLAPQEVYTLCDNNAVFTSDCDQIL